MSANRSNPENLFKAFAAEILKVDTQVDLGRAVLLMAKCEYKKLDVEFYLSQIDEMAKTIGSRLSPNAATLNPLSIINQINEYLYNELAFRGNKENYYDPRNSFLNEVLVRRLGIPITLSVLYMEIARRLGLTILGVGMPGHFLMKCTIDDQEIIIDAFNQGRILDKNDCQQLITNLYGTGIELKSSFFRAVSKKEILIRMLNNLKSIYLSSGDHQRTIATIECLLLITPQSINDIRDRGLVSYHLGKYSRAISDLEFYLNYAPKSEETKLITETLKKVKLDLASLN
jgi:regulator of sirC expression with transglutaminase-like and TPR domain